MPSDPNAGLIKALESVSRALAEHNRQLIDSTKAVKELTKEVKARVPRRMTITNTPYLERSEVDGGDGGAPSSGVSGLTHEGPYGYGPSQSDR